jgi:uncharacterized membrane protein YfcA
VSDYLVVCVLALVASGLSFFSGFGLGTVLLPAFALFFPLPSAIAITAVVHLLNNLFKLVLIGRYTDWKVVMLFGAPAVVSAFVGATALIRLSHLEPFYTYRFAGGVREVTSVGVVVAVLMIVFALFEAGPVSRRIRFSRRFLPLGGILSGFIGGLSGYQGALRSAFLIKCGLSKEAFIASGVMIGSVVDVVRIGVYGADYEFIGLGSRVPLIAAAVLAAFAGALVGRRLLPKVSLRVVQIVVAVMLLLIAGGVGTGLI